MTIKVRLAIRKEGGSVNAYLASERTMDGAVLMGSLAKGIAEHGDFFDRWKVLMIDAMSVAIEQTTGHPPDYMVEGPAPEHERGGNA